MRTVGIWFYRTFLAGSLWSGFKHSIGIGNNPVDEKADEHKEEFTAFVREIKSAFRPDNYILALTVLPNVNSTCKQCGRKIETFHWLSFYRSFSSLLWYPGYHQQSRLRCVALIRFPNTSKKPQRSWLFCSSIRIEWTNQGEQCQLSSAILVGSTCTRIEIDHWHTNIRPNMEIGIGRHTNWSTTNSRSMTITYWNEENSTCN